MLAQLERSNFQHYKKKKLNFPKHFVRELAQRFQYGEHFVFAIATKTAVTPFVPYSYSNVIPKSQRYFFILLYYNGILLGTSTDIVTKSLRPAVYDPDALGSRAHIVENVIKSLLEDGELLGHKLLTCYLTWAWNGY